MKKLRWQLLIIFLTGLVVGILLLGEQPQSVSPKSATPVPVKGGVYTEALVGSLLRINPLLNFYNAPDRDVSRLIFSGLVRFDGSGAPQPDLAETMGFSKDGTIYNVTLRKNARWHDGQPVTAADVIFTIDLMRKGSDIVPEDLQNFWKNVEAVKLTDQVLQFRLPEPFAPFPDYLAFGILPKHLLDGKTIDQMIDLNYNIQPVGSGPYRFDRLVVENGAIKGIVLASFKDYYGQKPYIDEIVFRYYADAPSALQAYKDGQVKGIANVTPDILPQALAEPNLAVYTSRQPEITMLFINQKSQEAAALQDVKVRQALFLGLNRQSIVDKLFNGQAVVADGPILPDTWAYYTGLKHVEYDPEAARAMLKEAGYVLAAEGDVVRKKGDVSLRFELAYPDDEQHQAMAESIRAGWTALGAEVSLAPVPYENLVKDRLETHDFQVVLGNLNLSRTPDPDPYPFWDRAQSAGGQNYTQWENPIASEYLEQARTTVNMQERAKFYRNFQIIFNQDLPAMPLYYPVYTYAVDREIQGVRVGPLFDAADRFANVTEWFLAGRQKQDSAAAPANVP